MMFTQAASLLGWQHSGRRIAIYDALIQGIRGELGYHVPDTWGSAQQAMHRLIYQD